jgi:hypothetical protein
LTFVSANSKQPQSPGIARGFCATLISEGVTPIMRSYGAQLDGKWTLEIDQASPVDFVVTSFKII